MYKAEGELKRVVSVLQALARADESLVVIHLQAQEYLNEPNTTKFYTYLRDFANYLNPYKPSDPRRLKKCMIAAFVRREHQAALAATFYLLSEGLYNQPHLPDLTKTH